MIFTDDRDFDLLGPVHIVMLAISLALFVGLPLIALKVKNPKITTAIAWVLGAVLILNQLSFLAFGYIRYPDVAAKYFLPLHICWMGSIICGVALITRQQFMYEIAYFWGFAGTLQAVITPDVPITFPSYWLIEYFIAHSGFIAGVCLMTWGMKMRPRLISLPLVLGFSVVYMVVLGGINYVLDANYMFLCEPPGGNSPFFVVDWPWYLLVLSPVAVMFVHLIYLPWEVVDYLKKRRKRIEREREKAKDN